MSRVLVFVEGQTEETFVRDLLVPYFCSTWHLSHPHPGTDQSGS